MGHVEKKAQFYNITIKFVLNPASGIEGGNQILSLKMDFYDKCIEDF